jgi:SAM-dependent methyltransferase
MTTTPPDTIDWQGWLRRWDAQQMGYLPEREARFTAMLDVLEALLPQDFVALDLACGPGAISQRLLARFPYASTIAVDVDPVLLTLGQRTLGDYSGRLRWVDADLRDPSWVRALRVTQVDAVLSTTALHWLPAAHLVRLYADLGQLVRPGGVFLNGDHMRFGPQLPTFRSLARTRYEQTLRESFAQAQVDDWKQWWSALAAEPGMQELFAERERRLPEATHDETAPIFDLHEGALRDAGFREVGVIWQRLDDRVLLAVR